MAGLVVENLTHGYAGRTVLNNVSMAVEPGEIVCLLGPSGCGKTTLLRVAAGLERRQSGRILVGDEVVADEQVRRLPEQRGVGFMFQDYALFPHLTVFQNVAFGLKRRTPGERNQRVSQVLDQVGMAEFGQLYPHTLSGGQQQRVALARALAPEPRVLLLDEPFSGLDETLRIQIREETLSILKATGVATLMVTHNPEEAMFMADRMLVLGPRGTILQAGPPAEVYMNPTDEFVASFFGQINRLSGTVIGGRVETPLGIVEAPNTNEGETVSVLVRTDGIQLEPGGAEGTEVEVISARPLGRTTFVRFRILDSAGERSEFTCRTPGVSDDFMGKQVTAGIIPGHAFVFPRGGDEG